MARLPSVGGSDGDWANLLNGFLQEEHGDDGTHEIVLVGARMYLTAAQNELGTGTETRVTLDTDDYDYNSLTNTTSNRITVDKAGIYHVNAQITFANVTSGDVQLRLDVKVNGNVIGTSLRPAFYVATYSTHSIPLQTTVACNANDYFELYATVTGLTGADLTTGLASTFLEVYRIGVVGD